MPKSLWKFARISPKTETGADSLFNNDILVPVNEPLFTPNESKLLKLKLFIFE